VNLPLTQASLEDAVLFLQIVDHFQLVAVDPTGEDDEQKLKRWKQWKHDEELYRANHITARQPNLKEMTFEFLDTTGNKTDEPGATGEPVLDR
jgi:predicted nucleotide-binding protein (sugar kinase/HSP70/actin superfamily)